MAAIDMGDNLHYTRGAVIESRQSVEALEKQVLNTLLSEFRIKGYPEDKLKTLKAKQVQSNVFTIGNDRIISMFCNEKGDVILNLSGVRDEYYFQKAGFLAGYREIPSNTAPVNLYHIRDIDNKGNPIPGAKPIDKFSREYYQAFMDIAFYDDKLILETFKKPDAIGKPTPESEKKFTKPDTQLLLSLAESAMRIKDLVILKKQGQVAENDYKSALAILQKNLLNTIGDYRFERVNQGVTREELDSYLKDGLIDKALYTRAIQKLEQVQKIKRAVGEKHSEITSQTQIKMAGLMNENGEKIV